MTLLNESGLYFTTTPVLVQRIRLGVRRFQLEGESLRSLMVQQLGLDPQLPAWLEFK